MKRISEPDHTETSLAYSIPVPMGAEYVESRHRARSQRGNHAFSSPNLPSLPKINLNNLIPYLAGNSPNVEKWLTVRLQQYGNQCLPRQPDPSAAQTVYGITRVKCLGSLTVSKNTGFPKCTLTFIDCNEMTN